MTLEQELIKKAVDAANKMPQQMSEEEYCEQYEEHKQWFIAFNDLRIYAETIPNE
jgi:hypothetical protein